MEIFDIAIDFESGGFPTRYREVVLTVPNNNT